MLALLILTSRNPADNHTALESPLREKARENAQGFINTEGLSAYLILENSF